jgi:hypothetical protein
VISFPARCQARSEVRNRESSRHKAQSLLQPALSSFFSHKISCLKQIYFAEFVRAAHHEKEVFFFNPFEGICITIVRAK